MIRNNSPLIIGIVQQSCNELNKPFEVTNLQTVFVSMLIVMERFLDLVQLCRFQGREHFWRFYFPLFHVEAFTIYSSFRKGPKIRSDSEVKLGIVHGAKFGPLVGTVAIHSRVILRYPPPAIYSAQKHRYGHQALARGGAEVSSVQ